MKIGLISDTHGSLKAWESSMEIFKECELILHAGDVLYHGPRNPLPVGYDPGELANSLNNFDKTIFIVKGNCDSEVDEMVLNFPLLSPYFYTNLGGLNILLIHGEGYSQDELFELGKTYGTDMLIIGHTHIPVLRQKDNVFLVNPGSPSIPKADDKLPSIGIIDTEERTVQIVSLDTGDLLEKIQY